MEFGGMPFTVALTHVAPIGMVWIIGTLLIWGHVCDATKCWKRDQERKEAEKVERFMAKVLTPDRP
jgi:hypothetical protein